jgi:hypothetical protein
MNSAVTTLSCPACDQAIPPDDVNVATNVAYCRACASAHVLAALAGATSDPLIAQLAQHAASIVPGDVDLAYPPRGCWYRDDGLEMRLGASCRSIAGAGGLLFFALFWNGIVSVFVMLALASTLRHAGVALPSWFPAPSNMDSMGLGMTLFLWVFLTPFITVGLTVLGAFVTTIAGRVEVVVGDDSASVFVGVGPIGWRRTFDPRGVSSVTIGESTWKQNDQSKPVVVIQWKEEGATIPKPLRFGALLPDDRRAFVAGALKKSLVG